MLVSRLMVAFTSWDGTGVALGALQDSEIEVVTIVARILWHLCVGAAENGIHGNRILRRSRTYEDLPGFTNPFSVKPGHKILPNPAKMGSLK